MNRFVWQEGDIEIDRPLACGCTFAAHRGVPCPKPVALVCVGCQKQLCADCSRDGERCASCYRAEHGVRPLLHGGRAPKRPKWNWGGQ